MDQARTEQLPDQQAHAAGGLEVVDIGLAVGIDPGQAGHRGGQLREVIPVDGDTRRRGHGHQVHGVVGGAAGGQEADHGVDDGTLVDLAIERTVVAAGLGIADRLFGGETSQRFAHVGTRVDEGSARQVQPHELHHQLVGVGGAVEGAGTGAVVALGLGFQQLVTADLALGEQLTDAGLFLVGQAAGHGPGRDEGSRQVAEARRADEQARHDLVAHAKIEGGVEHIVRQAHGGGHGDDVAGEQRQLHARLALGDAVAHGRHTAGELGGRAHLTGAFANHLGKGLERLVRRQHVVVRRDDAKVGAIHQLELILVLAAARGKAVGEVAAGQFGAMDAATMLGLHALFVEGAPLPGALTDALGDAGDGGIERRSLLASHGQPQTC